MIKFWRSCAPREGACAGGGGIWLCLTTASAHCLRLSQRFFIVIEELPHTVVDKFLLCINRWIMMTMSGTTTVINNETHIYEALAANVIGLTTNYIIALNYVACEMLGKKANSSLIS